MESYKSKILTILGLSTLLLFISLSYNHDLYLFTEIITGSLIVGCLVFIKSVSNASVIYTTTTTKETEKEEKTKTTKTPEHEFAESYSEQYS